MSTLRSFAVRARHAGSARSAASTACRVYIFLADPYEMERSKGLAAPFSYDFLSKAYERGPEVAPPEPFPYENTTDSYEKGARIVISRYAGQWPEPKL